MARRQRPQIALSFDDTHALLWDTRLRNFEFVHHMNTVYENQLACDKDLEYYLDDGTMIECPLYTYYDDSQKLMYILVENPIPERTIDPSLQYYDKILFVVGRDAQEMCHLMYHELMMGVEVEDPYDIRMGEHSAKVAGLRGGVLQVDYIDFVTPTGYDTSLMLNMNPTTAPKVKKRLTALVNCLQDLFQVVSDALDFYDDDEGF